MDGYRRGGHTKYCMKAHVILVTKYRKKYFCNTEQNDRIKQYAYEASQKHGFEILVMETDKDHTHLLIQYQRQCCRYRKGFKTVHNTQDVEMRQNGT